MGLKVWIDGELIPSQDARISVYDHGLLYGDGVFEGIRSYSGEVFRLAEHLNRLFASAEAIRLKIPYTAQELGDAIYQERYRDPWAIGVAWGPVLLSPRVEVDIHPVEIADFLVGLVTLGKVDLSRDDYLHR